MGHTTEETAPRSKGPPSQKAILHWMNRAFLAWLLLYLWKQGTDGFFARTVDQIESGWIKLVFLNIPLQILLALVTAACASSEKRAALSAGVWVGALNGTLVLVHVILSVATA